MRPNVEWLSGSGLPLDRGVVTDAFCRCAPGVYAAGDCARWWDVRHGAHLRVEHWDTAARHGVVAARNALGAKELFTPALFFWSMQHGVRLQAVGRIDGWDDVEISDGDGTFAAHYRCQGRLTAVLAADQPRVIAEARRELAAAA
jgi:NADPH-dependent 2,4-dienoyl-CoA reductase/sulfur reductase-like enzyme